MRLLTRQQCQWVDEASEREYSINPWELMQGAAHKSAEQILKNFSVFREVVIFVGPGHNGADGLLLACALKDQGFDCRTYYFSQAGADQYWKRAFAQVKNLSISAYDISEELPDFTQLENTLVVDAIFGTGLNRLIEGDYAEIIKKINKLKTVVLSLDIPSGLDANTGHIWGIAVKAWWTYSFGAAKPGFFIQQGPIYVGRVKVLDIGFPKELLLKAAQSHFLVTRKMVRRLLPQRHLGTANKSHFGRCLVIAGSPGMMGAGALACQAAARMGSGYVIWAHGGDQLEFDLDFPDFLCLQIKKDWEKIFQIAQSSAVVVGPGLGLDAGLAEQTRELIKNLLLIKHSRVVLDADALSVIASEKIYPLPESWIVTPHSGEAAKILGCTASEVENDRLLSVSKLQEILGCCVVLKGYRTLVGFKEQIGIIHSGNVALAKAGTGDVLSGFIGGLLAQKYSIQQSAVTASYLHGAVADFFVSQYGNNFSLMASDMKNYLPQVINEISNEV